MTIRTRFAPSPTGYMHIGNLRTALYAYWFAKGQGGQFIVRIEDTDRSRLVDGATELIFQTLRDVGIVPDEGPQEGGTHGPYTQSQRKSIYREYAQQLVQKGAAYPCFCTEERLNGLREEAKAKKENFQYDGCCRHLDPKEVQMRLVRGERYVIRQAISKTGTTSFVDAVYGEITVDNSSLSEGVLLKADGYPTYNFANVVDDHLMNITHVIRGEEYLSSTPRYILLYQAFGWDVPTHIHLPPIMRDSRKKFSKRSGDASFSDLLNQGYLKEAVINYIALLGWNPGTDQELMTMEELTSQFSLKGLVKSPAIFDEEKLKWMNGEYLRRLSLDEFIKQAHSYFPSNWDEEKKRKIAALVQQRVRQLIEIPETVDFIDDLPEYDIELYTHKKMKTTGEMARMILQGVHPLLKALPVWETALIHDALLAWAQEKGYKNGQVMYPLRVALSGKAVTPGGATEISEILGKEESLRRLENGIDRLQNALK